MLHIVNGECPVQALEQAGIPGDFLSWDDLLYEGPVPISDSLHRLSALRAEFVSDAGWSEIFAARERFERRDRILEGFASHDQVILWNSVELTDQLQLLQLLHWFSSHVEAETKIRILFVEDYLTQNAGSLLRSAWGRQVDVTKNQFLMAASLWSAFCADSPLELDRLRRDPALSDEFPFMRVALGRLFEEFPDARDGLSRTQRQILCALEKGPMTPVEIFEFSQSNEPRRFMGDWSCWRWLDRLVRESKPLIGPVNGKWIPFVPLRPDLHDGFFGLRIGITAAGRAVLASRIDALQLNGIDRWIGGVHLVPENIWRWNRGERRFCSSPL